MFKVLSNALKVKDIRDKLFYALLIVLIYRIGCHIPLPGIDLVMLETAKTGGTDINLFTMISGGGYGSIFQMGIGPYITSSIIMQLLTVAIPRLEQIQKEGEEGRKKIGQWTRCVAVGLAFLQGGSTVYGLCYSSVGNLFTYANFLTYAMATVSMVTGTIFIMWLGEMMTERGVGNGTSFIIFSNILAGIPTTVMTFYAMLVGGDIIDVIKVAALLFIFVVIIAFVILVQDGERRIPVQYSRKIGAQAIPGSQNSSFIPIKVNIAGVLSIIFSISLLQFPSVLNGFIHNDSLGNFASMIDITTPIGASAYVILIFCFTFFYTSFAINPTEIAENMKKSGGFVPGIRPGKPTADYIQISVDRLSWVGASAYAIIAITPVVLQWIFNVNVGFGGTTVLIVTGVALDIMKQLESQLLMRHYKGFLSHNS